MTWTDDSGTGGDTSFWAIRARIFNSDGSPYNAPTSGNNYLAGTAVVDNIEGLAGNDTFFGNPGNDILVGGSGYNAISGGSGCDTFVFDTTLNAINSDLITDFSHADDTIRLDLTIFTKLATGVLLSSQFRTTSTGRAFDRNEFILYKTVCRAIFSDVRLYWIRNWPTTTSKSPI